MQLIHRTTLHYREGTSDKVYEVDLCEVSQGRYVVNFRYGKRGASLKEGTKTTQPVSEAEARRVFDKLVASKVDSGYRDVATTPTAAAKRERREDRPSSRQQAILNRLANTSPGKWNLERAIWRAGELKIAEATPLLISLLGTGNALRDYCIAWSLGWCGGDEAIAALNRLYQNSSTPEFVRRIAWEALLKLADPETKVALRSRSVSAGESPMLKELPSQLQELARSGPPEAFTSALHPYLEGGDYPTFAILDRIYQIDNEYVRPALIEIIKTAPFRPNYFQRIRHIYKMAEYRHDAEVFGILAYRFEKEEAMYRSNSYQIHVPGVLNIARYEYRQNPQTRRWESFDNPEFDREKKRPDARVAYNNKTHDYFKRRSWRTLKQLGEEGDPQYVTMAAGVLKQYSDADAEQARQTTLFRYTPNWQRLSYNRDWDAYAAYITFNHILYENSPRYVLMTNSQAWRCKESYKPGDPEPSVREEAFPQLWEQHPEILLQLLLESQCGPVHQFAVKAIKACQSFCAGIDIPTIITLVNKPYEATAQFGFELAVQKYNRAEPNLELILALANCLSEPARNQAFRWIEEQRERFVVDSNAIAFLVTSQHADTRQFARRLLSSSILSDTTAKVLIGRIIAILLSLEPTEADSAKEIGETLLVSFTPQLRSIGFSVILDLLGHQLPEVQELGARILLNHEIPAVELPNELIESLLNSPFENVRGIGVRIFGQLPDEILLRRYELLLAMSVHELPDMRSSIRPVIRRLGGEHPDFAAMMAGELIHLLMLKERHEGVHSDILHLLKLDLVGWMSGVSRETAMRLLKAQSTAAQELGGLVLIANQEHWTQHFDTSEIVKLASHEIFSVREAARQMFLQRLNIFRTDSAELLAAVRILEAKWDDSREFADRIFRTEFAPEDFPPEILISICDSIKEDVRQFGRDLVTRNFQQSYGDEYLLKFSEHPSTDMQLFVTNYLESYAVNNPQRLQDLTPYFVTVLSRVNKGGVAKRRVFAFLEQEALKSETAARVVAEILTRQSATIAIGDKAKSIQIMLKIHQQYPQIPLPIQVQAVVQVRN